LSLAERAGLSDPVEARAVAYLEKARAADWFRDVKNREALDRDTDLDPLRARADFRAWLLTVTPTNTTVP
jgi:hypothetical protein